MKFVGFGIPEDILGNDWIHDVISDDGCAVFYLIEAKNPCEAREKLYKKIYSSWDKDTRQMMANFRACNILEDIDADNVLIKYGGKDGKLIIEISNGYFDNCKNYYPMHENIEALSEKAIYELAYEQIKASLVISKLIT